MAILPQVFCEFKIYLAPLHLSAMSDGQKQRARWEHSVSRALFDKECGQQCIGMRRRPVPPHLGRSRALHAHARVRMQGRSLARDGVRSAQQQHTLEGTRPARTGGTRPVPALAPSDKQADSRAPEAGRPPAVWMDVRDEAREFDDMRRLRRSSLERHAAETWAAH